MRGLGGKMAIGFAFVKLFSFTNAQEITFSKFYLHDLQSVVSYTNKFVKQTYIKSKIKNIPISVFKMDDKICGYFYSQYKGPFAHGPIYSSKWTSFIACNGESGPTKLLSASYVAEYVEQESKTPSMSSVIKYAQYIKEKEGIDLSRFQGPLSYIAFSDRVLLFYTYGEVKEDKEDKDFEFLDKFLLVKVYNTELKLERKQKIKIASEKVAKWKYFNAASFFNTIPGATSITNISFKKISEDKFAVIYSISNIVNERESFHSLHIKIFNKELQQQGEEIVINMPFNIGGKTEFVISDDGKYMYFSVPVVLLEEKDAKGFKGKVLGKKEEVRHGLFLVIYKIDLMNGEYDYGVVNLGNPEKKVSSQVFKMADWENNTFLVAVAWELGSKRGADILKLQIGEEMAILDKLTISLPNGKNNEKKSSPLIHDFVELDNNYLLIVSNMSIVLYIQEGKGGSSWYNVSIYNPTMVSVNKNDRSKREFPLYSGEAIFISDNNLERLIEKKNVYRNVQETAGFLKIGHSKALALFMISNTHETSKHKSKKLSIEGQTRYVSIAENDNGQIEVTKPKLFGPSEGNAASFGVRSFIYNHGEIYGVFSIDNIVPAFGKFKASDVSN